MDVDDRMHDPILVLGKKEDDVVEQSFDESA